MMTMRMQRVAQFGMVGVGLWIATPHSISFRQIPPRQIPSGQVSLGQVSAEQVPQERAQQSPSAQDPKPKRKKAPPNRKQQERRRVTNHIVATFFTEHKRVYEDGAFIFKRNPSYGHIERTMERLDEVFSDNSFYQFHREKIKRFIDNADRYYRMHIRSKMVDGGFVSGTQIKVFQSN